MQAAGGGRGRKDGLERCWGLLGQQEQGEGMLQESRELTVLLLLVLRVHSPHGKDVCPLPPSA